MKDSQSWPVATRDANGLTIADRPGSGAGDDDRDDAQPGDNEAPVRRRDEHTEAPEEFVADNDTRILREPRRPHGGGITTGRHRASRGRRH